MNIKRLLFVFMTFYMVAYFIQPAYAMRVVYFEILLNNKVVMESQTGDLGEPADTVWRYLHKLSFKPANGFKVRASSANPTRAVRLCCMKA
jgi:hypothetical protein